MTCAATEEQVRRIVAIDCDDLFDNWDDLTNIHFGEQPSKFSFENEKKTKNNKKLDLNVNLLEIFD